MSFFSFFRGKPAPPVQTEHPKKWNPVEAEPTEGLDIRRHFYNERGFQCYASFFAYWAAGLRRGIA